MSTSTEKPTNSRALLFPFTLALIVAMVAIQVIISMTGGQITWIAGILTALAACGIAIWLLNKYKALSRVRFGVVIAHAIAFVVVTTSFNAHAVLRAIAVGSGPAGFDTVSRELLATPWFGATLVMSAAWGVGLLIHLIGSVLGRGWES